MTTRFPSDPTSGYDLRVLALCRNMSGPRHLYSVSLDQTSPAPSQDAVAGIFATIASSAPPPLGRASPVRHLRFTDTSYLQRAFPHWFSDEVDAIRTASRQLDVTRLVVFGSALAGLARAVAAPRVLLDVCDSPALSLRRQYRHDRHERSVGQRLNARVHLYRLQRGEAVLPDWFSMVTTISEVDTAEIVRLHGGAPRNVHTIPNGVDEAFLVPLGASPARRGVVFWGNLAFAPNREAVSFFVRSVYEPYLKPQGVGVRIIGEGAERWLLELASGDPQLEVLGFVDDLANAVLDYPVMVNPMLIGSGMKNKVLEAFALGLVVVSTPLGLEAFPDAIQDRHFVEAEQPAGFADAVLRLLDDPSARESLRVEARRLVETGYRWPDIGEGFDRLLPVPTAVR